MSGSRSVEIRERSSGTVFVWLGLVTSPRFSLGSAKEFYGLASVEPFFDIGSPIEGTFGDRFRYNLGFGKQVSEALRIDLNYVFHRIRLPDEDGDFDLDDHVLRLRFFYSLNQP